MIKIGVKKNYLIASPPQPFKARNLDVMFRALLEICAPLSPL